MQGRVVLITGAAGGLGSDVAAACARAGMRLVLLGRKVRPLERLLDRLLAAGADATLYPLDLAGASAEDLAEMAARIGDEFGRLDGVLHCAADFPGLTPLRYTDPGEFARVLHVDLTARWWLTQACLPLLDDSAEGAVVFALDAPERGEGGFWGAYGIAQQAQRGLIAMAQAEQGGQGVRFSGVQPGAMRTSLRGKAYVEDDPTQACDPVVYAQAVAAMLGPDGAAWRGTVKVLA